MLHQCSPVSFVVSQIRELVPESQAYMDLLAFERKLDQTIMRKRLDIQEALKRPIKVCLSAPLFFAGSDVKVGCFFVILLLNQASTTEGCYYIEGEQCACLIFDTS